MPAAGAERPAGDGDGGVVAGRWRRYSTEEQLGVGTVSEFRGSGGTGLLAGRGDGGAAAGSQLWHRAVADGGGATSWQTGMGGDHGSGSTTKW